MADALLAIEGVNAYYAGAQALEDVSFEIAGGATSIIGRNGMGKTTLCNAIVGIPPARVTGSIRFRGKELVGQPSYRIAKLGIGYGGVDRHRNRGSAASGESGIAGKGAGCISREAGAGEIDLAGEGSNGGEGDMVDGCAGALDVLRGG